MNFSRFLIFFSLFFFNSFTYAQLDSYAYKPISDEYVLAHLANNGQTKALSNRFNLLVWNLKKGEYGFAFQNDFKTLSANKDLILTQEAMNDDQFPHLIKSLRNFTAWIAQTFLDTEIGFATGVATLSKTNPSHIFFRRSPGTEPVIKTHKMTIGTIFPLEDGQALLALNIHAINFVTNSEFYRQINDVAPFISRFPGKIIFAGDFNTWNPSRMDFLQKTMTHLGLKQLEVPNDVRTLKLDHIFVKGCLPEYVTLHSDVETSDHYPLSAGLNCR